MLFKTAGSKLPFSSFFDSVRAEEDDEEEDDDEEDGARLLFPK